MPQIVTYVEIIPRIVYFVMWIVVSVWLLLDLYLFDHNHYLSSLHKGIIILCYALLSVLYIWSYYVLCWGDPGSIEAFYKHIGVLENIKNGDIPRAFQTLPLCDKCHLPKPERTHHCGRCNQCYFRFDHHCPVLGNCIGLYNMKAFILMPFYGFLVLSLLCVAVSLVHRMWATIFIIPFLFSILMFSLSYCNNVCRNFTTFEGIMFKGKSNYSEGPVRNCSQIFGGCFGFMLPTKPPVSGFHWCPGNIEQNLPDRETPLLASHM